MGGDDMSWQIIGIAIGGLSAFGGALIGTASLAWWLAGRFTAVNDKIDAAEKLLTQKIDDHEKLDMTRFNKQDLAIMRIEMVLQNDGTPLHGI